MFGFAGEGVSHKREPKTTKTHVPRNSQTPQRDQTKPAPVRFYNPLVSSEQLERFQANCTRARGPSELFPFGMPLLRCTVTMPRINTTVSWAVRERYCTSNGRRPAFRSPRALFARKSSDCLGLRLRPIRERACVRAYTYYSCVEIPASPGRYLLWIVRAHGRHVLRLLRLVGGVSVAIAPRRGVTFVVIVGSGGLCRFLMFSPWMIWGTELYLLNVSVEGGSTCR